ncbi:MAG: 30S ribosomal protein S9 [Holophagales bacterium]|jgi:small subunit ribosomal protein S9|nr:30S ribosomal protein S9 [Holophagales bacterium]
MTITQHYGTGRRKTSVARVFLRPGAGEVTVNGRTLENYFPNAVLRMVVHQPLTLAEMAGKFDMVVTVCGGGPAGQASAIRMGLSRALLAYNEQLKAMLRRAGLLTRDPRMKERKKPGLMGARRRFQFSKR